MSSEFIHHVQNSQRVKHLQKITDGKVRYSSVQKLLTDIFYALQRTDHPKIIKCYHKIYNARKSVTLAFFRLKNTIHGMARLKYTLI